MRSLLCVVVLAACTSGSTKGTTPVSPTGATGLPTTTSPTGTTLPTPFYGLKAGSWQYVPVPGMQCANGSGTGIGVNPGTDPTQLWVLVAGGGACWDSVTCFGDPKAGTSGVAVNIENDWGSKEHDDETAALARTNPGIAALTKRIPDLTTATWIYIPYCTGDLHTGDTVQAYDKTDPKRLVHHVGDANWQAWVDYLETELPGVDQLWLYGVSAGGYGGQMQADQLLAAWPTATGAIFADGAAMVDPMAGLLPVWKAAWSMRTPPGCTDCATSLQPYVEDALVRAKTWRLGVATSDADLIVRAFFAYPKAGDFTAEVDALVADVYLPEDRAWGFVAAGTQHVLLPSATTLTSRGGVGLDDFFVDFMNDAAPSDAP